MSEIRLIDTEGEITIVEDDIFVLEYYPENSGNNILAAIIKDIPGNQGGVDFLENDLIVIVINYGDPLVVYINDYGELIIIDNNALQYQISAQGSLEFVE